MNTVLHLNINALPGKMILNKGLSDNAFEAMCATNDLVQFERTREGEIVMNPPAGGSTSSGNAEIIFQLSAWWKSHRAGKVFDSSCGFFLADGSMLSPDAAYVLPEKLSKLRQQEMEKLLHLCPDFVVELLSRSDSLRDVERKMKAWIANGAALGWLINPYKQRVVVYSPGTKPVVIQESVIQGSGPVEGFRLDLAEVWDRYRV